MVASPKLTAGALQTALGELPDWQLEDGKLHRQLRFADFRRAFAFMTEVALAAEAQQHHPEWRNVYGTVEIWLCTHDADGITALDLQLARSIDAAAR